MEKFLNWLEKFLTWFFALTFGALLIYAGLRYRSHVEEESDLLLQAKKQNTPETYLAFLRECRRCPEEQAVKKALDALQQRMGLLSRLSSNHLPERAGITQPVFSPDGKIILATGGRGPDFWDAETGRRASHGDKTFTRSGGRHQVDALDFAADGRRIGAGMVGRDGGRLMIWDLSSEALVGEREVEAADIRGVLFSPDSAWLAWRGDGPVGLWNPMVGRFLRGTHEGVSSMAFLREENGGSYFLTAGGHELMTWEPTSMEAIKHQLIDSDRALLGLSRDGRVVAFSDGQVLELWDTAPVRPLAELRDLVGDITAFCRETATGRIVVGTQVGRVYLWDPLASPVPLGYVAAHEGPVETLACGGEGRAISTGWDGARVWNLDKIKGQPVAESARQRK